MGALREEVGALSAGSDDAEREIGEVLFATVAAARKLGVDAESALRRITRGFAERYERLLALAQEGDLALESVTEDEVREVFREARDP